MLKCRAPIQVRANTTFPSNLPTGWHVDYPYPEAKTAILYFSSHEDAPTLLKLDKKVVPIDAIENRLLMLCSIIEHKAVYSKNYQRRIVLNLNWF
jgi:hypothetical protein